MPEIDENDGFAGEEYEEGSRLRNLVFTINNWTEDDEQKLKEFAEERASYMIYGKEIGKSQTPHLQGYMELKKQTTFKTVKKGLPRAWLQQRFGTPKQASDYCKKDEDFFEMGEMSKQGERTDIKKVYEAIKSGKRKRDVAEEFPIVDCKYHRGLDRYRSLVEQDERKGYRELEVHIIWGDAGTNKTRDCYEKGAFILNEPDGDRLWWSGYEGEKSIVLDDFTGWLKYRHFLKILDGYPMMIEPKGGTTWANWETVYITSNVHPRQWYKRGIPASFKRRITSCEERRMVDGEIVKSETQI